MSHPELELPRGYIHKDRGNVYINISVQKYENLNLMCRLYLFNDDLSDGLGEEFRTFTQECYPTVHQSVIEDIVEITAKGRHKKVLTLWNERNKLVALNGFEVHRNFLYEGELRTLEFFTNISVHPNYNSLGIASSILKVSIDRYKPEIVVGNIVNPEMFDIMQEAAAGYKYYPNYSSIDKKALNFLDALSSIPADIIKLARSVYSFRRGADPSRIDNRLVKRGVLAIGYKDNPWPDSVLDAGDAVYLVGIRK